MKKAKHIPKPKVGKVPETKSANRFVKKGVGALAHTFGKG